MPGKDEKEGRMRKRGSEGENSQGAKAWRRGLLQRSGRRWWGGLQGLGGKGGFDFCPEGDVEPLKGH